MDWIRAWSGSDIYFIVYFIERGWTCKFIFPIFTIDLNRQVQIDTNWSQPILQRCWDPSYAIGRSNHKEDVMYMLKFKHDIQTSCHQEK